MFSYKWNDINGNQRIARFYGEWKQLNSCKAATLHKKFKSFGTQWNCEESFLVSYDTAIGCISYFTPKDGVEEAPQIVVGLTDDYNYSATTRSHVSKWLQNVDFFTNIPVFGLVSYQVLKHAMNKLQKSFTIVYDVNETLSVVRLSEKELCALMKDDASDVLSFYR